MVCLTHDRRAMTTAVGSYGECTGATIRDARPSTVPSGAARVVAEVTAKAKRQIPKRAGLSGTVR